MRGSDGCFCRDSPALTQLILLYVNRGYHVWKENDLLGWLERNVHVVLDRVDAGDPVVQDYEAKRAKRYQGQMPLSIARHIILSDIKGVSPLTNVSRSFIAQHNRIKVVSVAWNILSVAYSYEVAF